MINCYLNLLYNIDKVQLALTSKENSFNQSLDQSDRF